jgi:hypothetical protein
MKIKIHKTTQKHNFIINYKTKFVYSTKFQRNQIQKKNRRSKWNSNTNIENSFETVNKHPFLKFCVIFHKTKI